MRQNQSKIYRANYKGKNVQVHVKRLAAFGLALVIIKSGHALITKGNDSDIKADTTEQFQSIEDRNIALIETIIKENPYILYDITMETYEIQPGDTLSAIAERSGNTLSRICSLNNIDSKKIIYPGDKLKVEIIKEKNELDKKITSLESYLHNYAFSSPIAVAARTQSDDVNDQLIYYKSILYGNPKKFAAIDPTSFYGTFVTNYMKFHEKQDITDKNKEEYISILANIATELESKLNLNGNVTNIVPYSKYYIYLQNRTTEYDTIVETHRTIYS